MQIPLEGVRRIEVVQDYKRRWLSGMGIGALTGATLGIVIGVAATDYEPSAWLPDMAPAYGIAIGAPVGFIVGAIIGSFIRDEEWEQIPLDGLRVSFTPKRDGFTLGLSVSF